MVQYKTILPRFSPTILELILLLVYSSFQPPSVRRRKAEGAGYSVSSDSSSRIDGSRGGRSVGTLEEKKRLLERYFPDNPLQNNNR